MKTTTNVTNGKGFRSTVSITKEYKLNPEHFKVLDILILEETPDIYKGVKSERARQIRYNAIRTLSQMNVLGSHLDGDAVTHFLTEYGDEVVRKIIKADCK